MNGPLVTDGFRLSGEVKTLSGATLMKWCAGNGACNPSVHTETNGEKLCLRWKVIVSLSGEITVEVIRLMPIVWKAGNLGLVHNLQLKSTSSALRGWPSDHLRPGRRWNVHVLESALTPPLAMVGISVAIPGLMWPVESPTKSGA